MMCPHCASVPYREPRKGNKNRRGLCDGCWKVLHRAGTIDVLYPPKKPVPGTSPLLWHGRQGGLS